MAEADSLLSKSENEPVKLVPCNFSSKNRFLAHPIVPKNTWMFKGFEYQVEGLYTDDQFRLMILEDFDNERKYFEKLKLKHDQIAHADSTYTRPRVPESVRIEVWRRDGGKCVRCEGRENLEYDHIVPISKGGSNTARNIELLCETCNRSKGANIA